MDFLEKLRSLPEFQKKLILWSFVVVLALIFFILWVRNVRGKLQSFPGAEVKEQLQLPETPRIEMPAIELPEISEEELR